MEMLLNLKTTAYYRYIRLFKRAAEIVLESLDVKEDDIYALKLAVAEAAANVIEHGYGVETEENIELEVYLEAKELTFVLRDYGTQSDVSDIKSRELDDYQEGGLGVHIIRTVMDSVEYIHMEKGTKLIMKKKID